MASNRCVFFMTALSVLICLVAATAEFVAPGGYEKSLKMEISNTPKLISKTEKGICASDKDCKNGGECVDLAGTKMCNCPKGSTGPYCETIPACDKVHCEDSASCKLLKPDGTVGCKCKFEHIWSDWKYDYVDKRCRTECKTQSDCMNNGTCEETVSGKFCRCVNGTTGSFCQNIPACKNIKCGSDAICQLNKPGGTPFCQCKNSIFAFDEKDKKCKSLCTNNSDCKNGGICKEGGKSQKFCSCLEGTEGAFCGEISGCKYRVCRDDAKCVYDIAKRQAVCKCELPEWTYDEEKKRCKINVPEEVCSEERPKCPETNGNCEILYGMTRIECQCSKFSTYIPGKGCTVKDYLCTAVSFRCVSTQGYCTRNKQNVIQCNCPVGKTYSPTKGCTSK